MSIAAFVTGGIGPGSSIPLLVTRGLAIGVASVFWLDAAAAGAGTGTEGDPWKSFSSAPWADGDTYNVVPGTSFGEAVTFGAGADNVTIQSTTAAKFVLDGTGLGDVIGLDINNRSGVTVDKIEVQNFDNYGIKTGTTDGALGTNLTVTNFIVHDCGAASAVSAIRIAHNGFLFEDGEVYDVAEDCFFGSSHADNTGTFRRCNGHDFGDDVTQGDFIDFGSPADNVGAITVDDCICNKSNDLKHGILIYSSGVVTVQDSTFTWSHVSAEYTRNAITIGEATTANIVRNIFSGKFYASAVALVSAGAGVATWNFDYNLIVDSGRVAVNADTGAAGAINYRGNTMYQCQRGLQATNTGTYTIQNNIAYETDVWPIRLETGAPVGATIDYNLWYPLDAATVFRIDDATNVDFDGWQALGHDANGTDADPLLVSSAGSIYDESPARYGGTWLGPATDVYGTAYVEGAGSAQNMGAVAGVVNAIRSFLAARIISRPLMAALATSEPRVSGSVDGGPQMGGETQVNE